MSDILQLYLNTLSMNFNTFLHQYNTLVQNQAQKQPLVQFVDNGSKKRKRTDTMVCSTHLVKRCQNTHVYYVEKRSLGRYLARCVSGNELRVNTFGKDIPRFCIECKPDDHVRCSSRNTCYLCFKYSTNISGTCTACVRAYNNEDDIIDKILYHFREKMIPVFFDRGRDSYILEKQYHVNDAVNKVITEDDNSVKLDMCFVINNKSTVVIEIDKNCHSGYNPKDEDDKNKLIFDHFKNKNCLLIRINWKNHTVNQSVWWKVLHDWIQLKILHPKFNALLYLFYITPKTQFSIMEQRHNAVKNGMGVKIIYAKGSPLSHDKSSIDMNYKSKMYMTWYQMFPSISPSDINKKDVEGSYMYICADKYYFGNQSARKVPINTTPDEITPFVDMTPYKEHIGKKWFEDEHVITLVNIGNKDNESLVTLKKQKIVRKNKSDKIMFEKARIEDLNVTDLATIKEIVKKTENFKHRVCNYTPHDNRFEYTSFSFKDKDTLQANVIKTCGFELEDVLMHILRDIDHFYNPGDTRVYIDSQQNKKKGKNVSVQTEESALKEQRMSVTHPKDGEHDTELGFNTEEVVPDGHRRNPSRLRKGKNRFR